MTQLNRPPGPPRPPLPPPYFGPGYTPGGMPPLLVRNNGAAIGALVCGLLSLLLPVLLSVPAIILGIVGLHAINQSRGTQSGKGMAVSGLVLGLVTLLLTSLLVVLTVLAPDNDTTGSDGGSQTAPATASLARVLGPACRGIGVPSAAAYRDGGPFAAVLVNGRGRTIDWTSRNASWKGSAPEDTALVACVRTTQRLIETCPYTGGFDIERYTQVVRVRVVAARTVRVVDAFTLSDPPRPCHFTEWSYTTELVGHVPFKKVSAGIAEIAARPATRR